MPNGERVLKRGDVVGMITRPRKFHIGIVLDESIDTYGEIVCIFWSPRMERFSGNSEGVRPQCLDYLGKLSDFGIDLKDLRL